MCSYKVVLFFVQNKLRCTLNFEKLIRMYMYTQHQTSRRLSCTMGGSAVLTQTPGNIVTICAHYVRCFTVGLCSFFLQIVIIDLHAFLCDIVKPLLILSLSLSLSLSRDKMCHERLHILSPSGDNVCRGRQNVLLRVHILSWTTNCAGATKCAITAGAVLFG